MTDKLQCLLNAAARLLSDTKFDRGLTQLNACRPLLARRAAVSKIQTRIDGASLAPPESSSVGLLDGLLHSYLRCCQQ